MKIGNRPEIYKDTKDNTVESNNKMIAEFMGLYAGDKQYWNPDRKGCGIIDFAKYHKDWNWLMPVIHKIEQYKFRDDQDDYAFMSTLHSGMCRINRFPLFEADTLIEAAYQSVVDFVKWYNDETN